MNNNPLDLAEIEYMLLDFDSDYFEKYEDLVYEDDAEYPRFTFDTDGNTLYLTAKYPPHKMFDNGGNYTEIIGSWILVTEEDFKITSYLLVLNKLDECKRSHISMLNFISGIAYNKYNTNDKKSFDPEIIKVWNIHYANWVQLSRKEKIKAILK